MSVPEQDPSTQSRTPTPIRPLLPPDAPFYKLRVAWQKEIGFRPKLRQSVVFAILVISAVLLFPYRSLLLPQLAIEIPKQQIPIKIKDSSIETADYLFVLPRYVAPGRTAHFEGYVRQTTEPAPGHTVVFGLGVEQPSDTTLVPKRSELLFVKGLDEVWEAASVLKYDIPHHTKGRTLELWLRAEIVSDGAPPPVNLRHIHVPIVRWPSYVVQLVAFLGTLGILGYNQLEPLISLLASVIVEWIRR